MSRWQWSFAMRGVLFTALALVPATVVAQNAEIAGVVRDTSGAVLPGVTVEASSPALIEKSRTVFTDSQGQYRVIALSPGTYRVTFTLPGFKTVARDGIVLTAQFTAGIDASHGGRRRSKKRSRFPGRARSSTSRRRRSAAR